jgi:hypothetical protein
MPQQPNRKTIKKPQAASAAPLRFLDVSNGLTLWQVKDHISKIAVDGRFVKKLARESLSGTLSEPLSLGLEKRIDKRRNGRAMRKNDQQSHQQQHKNHGNHPPELAFPEKLKKFSTNVQSLSDGSDDFVHGRYLSVLLK